VINEVSIARYVTISSIFFRERAKGRIGFIVRMWAYLLHCFIATSTPGENSLIVNPIGRILAESSFYSRVISARINLDCAVLHIDYNHSKVMEMKKKYGSGVEVEIMSPEAVMLVTSHLKDRSIYDLIREFELEPIEDYFNRARAARRRK